MEGREDGDRSGSWVALICVCEADIERGCSGDWGENASLVNCLLDEGPDVVESNVDTLGKAAKLAVSEAQEGHIHRSAVGQSHERYHHPARLFGRS